MILFICLCHHITSSLPLSLPQRNQIYSSLGLFSISATPIFCHYFSSRSILINLNETVSRLKSVFKTFSTGIFTLPCMGIFAIWGLRNPILSYCFHSEIFPEIWDIEIFIKYSMYEFWLIYTLHLQVFY